MENPETLENTERAIKNGKSRETSNKEYTRHKTKKNKTTQYVSYTTMRKQKPHRNKVNKHYYKQQEVKTNQTSFSSGNRNSHHNKELII